MESGGSRTVTILRRIKRKSIGMWTWNAYQPMKALPEENSFDLLDEREKIIGKIVYGKMRLRAGAEVSTPWGPAKIEWPKLKVKILLNGEELARIDMTMLGKKSDFVFRDGAVMQFNQVKGRRNDILYTDLNGFVSFTEEQGTLPEGHPELGVQMTKEEIKRLPKSERPHSIATHNYVQYRITTEGLLPVSSHDIVATLMIFAGFMRLLDEAPSPI
jgi:hypothetical protein